MVNAIMSLFPTASATGTYISVPTTFLADLFDIGGKLFTDLWPVITLAIAVPLIFYVIKRSISLVPHGTSGRKG